MQRATSDKLHRSNRLHGRLSAAAPRRRILTPIDLEKNVLSNSEFVGWSGRRDISPAHRGPLCPGWSVEYYKGVADPHRVRFSPHENSDQGLVLQAISPMNWVRVMQPLDFGAEVPEHVALHIDCDQAIAGADGPRLDWIATLSIDATGKRLLSDYLLLAKPHADKSSVDIVVPLKAAATRPPRFLCLHFVGGAGLFGVRRITLTPVELKPDTPQKPPAPPPEDIKSTAELRGVEGERLIGWARLAKAGSEVTIVVDGKLLAETRTDGLPTAKASDDPQLYRYGFSVAVPAQMATGTTRRVLLVHGDTGEKIIAADIFFPLRTEAPPLVKPSKAPPALRAPQAVPPPALVPEQAPVPATAAEAMPASARPRATIVAWDMAHNPVGRAFLLADMAARDHEAELVGPMFEFYGGRLWPPIGDTSLPIRSFHATDLKSLLTGAIELAAKTRCDVVHVGKPRLPSLVIGEMIRRATGAPMVVDIDDHELSFVKNRNPATLEEVIESAEQDPKQFNIPHSEIWTRFAEALVAEADGITVSNVALRRRFGGITVRHGRDEALFEPMREDRDAIRQEFGYAPEDRIILFLGTPRAHKGIFAIADALERIDDPRLALCIIGSVNDKRTLARFKAYGRARIALHPDQPFDRLAALVGMADVVPILQDPASPIAEFQIPAKLTDALAMDIPVLATPVPPLADLALGGGFETVADESELEFALRRIAGSPAMAPAGGGRALFLQELSYGVNVPRLGLAYSEAMKLRRRRTPLFDRLFRLLEARTGIALPGRAGDPPRRQLRAPLIKGESARDLVFLWKQNDSDIYGRRSDMMARYMLRTGRVRRIIHFDAPLSSADLERQAQHDPGAFAHQGNLIYLSAVKRVLRCADTPNFARRTFLFRPNQQAERAFGMTLPRKSAYPDFIRDTLRELQVQPAPLLWVCPVVHDYGAVADAIRPGFVVADIIDDQRRFGGRPETLRRFDAGYRELLQDADAVFCNCEPVREAFADQRSDIQIVPNGAEIFHDLEHWEPAPDLAGMKRPIIGYVGNLRDRVNFPLILAVADRFPEATIVIVGSAHGQPETLELAQRPNIRLLGVKPHDEALRIIRGFDVAMIPHLRNELSESMNPLKLYVYFSLGVPVVSTDVANIEDLAAHVRVAPTDSDFLDAVEDILTGGSPGPDEATRARVLQGVSWERRVGDVWNMMYDVP